MSKHFAISTLTLCLIFSTFHHAAAQTSEYRTTLPRADASQALRGMPQQSRQVRIPDGSGYVGEARTAVRSQQFEMNANSSRGTPFVVPDTMIIKFKPDVSGDQINDYISSNNFKVIQSYPSIGAIQVEADISKYFQPKVGDKSVNDYVIRGLVAAGNDFKKDDRVLSASPDVYLTNKAIDDATLANEDTPSEVMSSTGAAAAEQVDWGVTDIEADKLWSNPLADDGVIFGVVDAGFARHEDITFVDLPGNMPVSDHGNHVAAIACGKHNGVGVKGVLSHCTVRARHGEIFFASSGDAPTLAFLTTLSQILSSLENFITETDDVKTFNVSLGYNWRKNFNVNPDLPEAGEYRQLVELQGVMLVAAYESTEKEGKVIFSAAGNDSSGLATPTSAMYASPFNWAAIHARKTGLSRNGIVVGAHDSAGKRASFSNSGAMISCPGVGIMSAVAFDTSRAPSKSSYGKMSGTSMASPLCAAGLMLFRLVRPAYTGVEAAKCIMSSTKLTDAGVPMLKLSDSLVACP